MPTFHYRSVTVSGDVVSGTMDVDRQETVVARLHQQGQTPLSIGTAGRRFALLDALNKDVITVNPVSEAEILTLTRSIATLLDAGVPLDRALAMTQALVPKGTLKGLVGDLLGDVREGAGLAAALDRHPSVFPPLYRTMVHAGEAGASLDEVLGRLAAHMEKAGKLKAKLRSALIYPAFLITAAIGAVIILLTVVVPSFRPMFEEAGAELPASTAIVIGAGGFLQSYWWALALGGLVLATGLMAVDRSPRGRLALHGAALKIPVIGGVWLKTAVARIARTLGVLLQNGVSLPQALALARGVAGNAAIAAELERVEGDVQLGKGLARPLSEGTLFPPLAVQLIQVGEETGGLDPMILKLADIYEDETATAIDRVMSLLTPVLTLVIGVLIAFIISSILFALFSINELAR